MSIFATRNPNGTGLSIELFHSSLEPRIYKKVTGKSGDMESWAEVKAGLMAFGQSHDLRLRAAREKGLGALRFFSSSEAVIAVAMLAAADHGQTADELSQKMGWWSSYTQNADESTRALVGKLVSP